MPLYKSSQLLDGLDAKDDFENFGDEDEVVLYDEKPSKDDVIEMHQPEEKARLSFELGPIPGSDAPALLEVSTDDDDEEEAKGKDKNDLAEGSEMEVKDPSDFRSYKPAEYPTWVHYMFQNLPRHSGRETTGIERCISYLKRLDSDISKAIASDYKGEADIGVMEEARREIYAAIERLEDALENIKNTSYKKKKAAAIVVSETDLVKEGQKATAVGGIIVTVPIFISRLARICINGSVSAGHDIEDLYGRLVKKYALDNQQQAELMQLLFDMGYPLRRDRGYNVDELIDETSSDNFDWSAQYPS